MLISAIIMENEKWEIFGGGRKGLKWVSESECFIAVY